MVQDTTFPTEAAAPTNETHSRVKGMTATLRVPNLDARSIDVFDDLMGDDDE